MSRDTTRSRDMATGRKQPRRPPLRRLGTVALHAIDRLLPHNDWIDGNFRLLRFWRANRRLPRWSGDPAATFNDFILERMISDDWTQLERTCIDKQYAKLLAASLCPGIKISKTELVISLESETDTAEAFRILISRIGRNEVAKPTHGSGAVLFLRNRPRPEAIVEFCERASRSYHGLSRESQYKGLARKIIVEQDLSGPAGPLADYKFFCSHGDVLFCQVDVDRFTRHRRSILTSDFEPVNVRFAYDWPDLVPAKPENFADMLQAARELSGPFCFVRVDLYSVGTAVYFGEFTFAPEGGAGALSNEAFGVGVMERIRSRILRQECMT